VTNDPATPFPDVSVYGHGGLSEGAGAIIKERGCSLTLHFSGPERDATLLELRIRPDRGKRLDPAKARELIPELDLYLATARAALAWEIKDFREAVEALQQVTRPGRGYPDDHNRIVAKKYNALVAEGEAYPVKALAAMYPGRTHISTASRWITEARRRGYLPPKEASSHAS
jgi:hypothetical protein